MDCVAAMGIGGPCSLLYGGVESLRPPKENRTEERQRQSMHRIEKGQQQVNPVCVEQQTGELTGSQIRGRIGEQQWEAIASQGLQGKMSDDIFCFLLFL